ncbi:hypothetical protein [Spiroplasma endosymbiont of Colias croceus]|uniref:hypothetical protein n=1 Tax=Spiroplasma endosymbiont of Colias croceus TaxID=3066310 RepID=UPI0030D41C91
MKYFNPTYWFKLWLLSGPLFNSENQGIYAKSIDNQNIKDWASKNTSSLESINQELTLSNNQTSLLNLPLWNSNLTIHNQHHKHRHQKSRNRIKKQVTPNPRPSKEILKLNEKIIINQNNRREYQISFQTIINELVDRGVLRRIRDLNVLVNADFICEDNTILALNPESNYGYFRLPVAIRWEQDTQSIENNLELVLRTDNLYLQGFIVNNYYYHFDFTNINMNMQPQAVRDGSVPLLERIEGIQNNIVLNGISPDYRDMIRENDENIYWSNIWGSFFQLINRMDDNFNEQGILIEGALGNLARSLGDVILVTAESLRFWSLHTHIIQQLVNNNEYITLGRNNRNPIYNTLVNWSEESRTQSLIIDLLSTPNDRRHNPNSNQEARNILTEFGYLRRRDDEHFVNFLSRILILPINQLTNILGHSNIRIILSFFIKRNLDNCNRRQARQIINNNYWHEKFCDLKPQIDKIQGKITAIKVLDEKTQGGNLKEGTIYVGTDNGVYLIYPEGHVSRFDNLNFPIKDIILDGNGSAYVINDKCEIYHLNLIGWGSEKLSNMESCDLNKELKIYYNYNHENEVYHHQILFLTDSLKHNEIFTINLKSIHPVNNYKKMEFIGDVYSDKWGVKSAWGSWVSDGNKENYWPSNHYDLRYFMSSRNNNFHDIIKNKKFDEINIQNNNIEENFPMLLQKVNGANLLHTMWYESRQRAGLSWYRENNNYYLQFITYQYLNWQGSGASLDCWMKVGNGFRLYNDDTEAQISNSNDRKKRNIISNSTKWTNEFTKSINHEQHLAINNKTNFSTNNITSL